MIFAIAVHMAKIRTLGRTAAWLAVIIIIVLSLIPGEYRPQSGMPKPAEHFAAYFLTAVVFVWWYGPYYTWIIAGLCGLSALMETLQIWIPGRDGEFIDFVASSGGVVSGVIIGAAVLCAVRLVRGN
jgi:hypothetical protein